MTEIHQIFLTEKCNQNCIFCSYDRKNINLNDLSSEKIKEKISKIPMGSEEIILDGGEPTIRKGLFEFAGLAKKRKPKRLTLCTNGLMLSYENFSQHVKDVGFDYILVSLHSHKKEISDSITRVKGAFEKTVKGIKNLVNSGANVSLSFVINELNYKGIIDYLKFVEKEFGKLQIVFSFVMPSGNVSYNDWVVPKISDVQPYLLKALKYCEENKISFSFTGCSIPPCFLPGYEKYTGEFLLKDNEFIMERQTGKHIRHVADGKVKPESCKTCEYDSVCGGLWEGYVEKYGFSELPYEKKSENPFLHDLKLFEDAEKKLDFKNSVDLVYDSFLRHRAGEVDEDFIKKKWKDYIKGNKGAQYDYYIHFPFCRSACSYCIYPSTKYDEASVSDYVAFLKQKIIEYAPLFKGVELKTFYMGGGTPSLLKAEQMEDLFDTLFSNYNFSSDGERTIEFNPDSITRKKMGVIKKFGFNRVSLGVQSLDKDVLMKNSRGYQSYGSVKAAVELIKSFSPINASADLVLGLKGDTKEKFLYSFKRLTELPLDTIYIYPIKTTEDYIRKNYSSVKDFEDFYFRLHDGVSKELFQVSDRFGYPIPKHLGFIHPTCITRHGHKDPYSFYYGHHDTPQHAIFGLGYYSNPIIPGVLDYRSVNKNNKNNLYLKNFSPEKEDFIYVAESYSEDFEKVKYIVLHAVEEYFIDKEKYLKEFNSDILDDYGYAIDSLKSLGIIKLDEKGIRFKKMKETDVFKYLLFFVGRDRVKKKLGDAN